MKRLSEWLTGFLIQNGTIDISEEEIYSYGFQITMANAVNLLIAFLIGCMADRLWEVALFYLLFIFSRSYGGGYHADSYGKCLLSFAVCIILMLLASKVLCVVENHLLIISGVTFAIYGVTVWWFTPCPNKHVTLTQDEQSQYRKVCKGILLITGCIFVLLLEGSFYRAANVMLVTIWEIVFLLWLGRRIFEKDKRAVVEKNS